MININSLLAILSWIAIVLLVAIVCRANFPNARELSRKIVHIGVGPVIPLAWWQGITSEIAIPIASIITICLVINHRFKLLPAVEDIKRHSYGTVAYGLSITLLLIFFWSTKPSIVTAGVLAMAFGDGLAGLIGRTMLSPKWKVFGQTKSIAGTMAMAITVASILLVMTLLGIFTFHPLGILLITSIAVILEQISPWGIDNLTVPIAVAYSSLWIIDL